MRRSTYSDQPMLKDLEQGDFHHRLLNSRRRCQSSSNTNEKLDIDHLLRSRGNLRRHHVYRLLRQTCIRRRRSRLFSREPIYGIRSFLVGPYSGHVQLNMWRLGGDQRE